MGRQLAGPSAERFVGEGEESVAPQLSHPMCLGGRRTADNKNKPLAAELVGGLSATDLRPKDTTVVYAAVTAEDVVVRGVW